MMCDCHACTCNALKLFMTCPRVCEQAAVSSSHFTFKSQVITTEYVLMDILASWITIVLIQKTFKLFYRLDTSMPIIITSLMLHLNCVTC